MNHFARWYLSRTMRRIAFESAVYGSCHTQLKQRTSKFMRWIFGPYKYVFIHPYDEICRCNWKNGPTVQSLCKKKCK